ncbi:DUF885 family protein, partial [Nocardioides cavernae]|uniref:DUF885 family protein n=1 Tax=Nocardioides cavernae TaxID=1921566 RepID=UPI00200DC232|nr:DUF885 family protein [Nocardioides cavernae]
LCRNARLHCIRWRATSAPIGEFMRLAIALILLPAVPLMQANLAAPEAVSTSTAQDAALLVFLDGAYDEQLALSPESQTQLGLKTNYGRLDDYTDAAALRAEALAERQLAAMRAQFKPAQLGDSARVSYRLFEYEVERGR